MPESLDMTLKELKFTRFLRSKGMAFILAVLSVVMTRQAAVSGHILPDVSNHGFVFPSPQMWWPQGPATMWGTILLVLVIAGLMIYVNRRFNVLRTLSVYFGGLFLVMAAATPGVTVFLSGAVLLPIILLGAMSLLYRSFNSRQAPRYMLLAFFLLGTGALFQYGFLFYVPVFLVGIGQMRVFGLKTLLAALMGLLAPLWIAWGAGWAPFDFWNHIHVEVSFPTTLSAIPGGIPYIASLAFTILLGVALGMVNFFKIYAYNARARAYNGLLSGVSVFTAIFAVLNYANSQFYILMLDCCVAFQMGHYFRIYLQQRAYIVALALMAVYGGIYVWSTFLS